MCRKNLLINWFRVAVAALFLSGLVRQTLAQQSQQLDAVELLPLLVFDGRISRDYHRTTAKLRRAAISGEFAAAIEEQRKKIAAIHRAFAKPAQ